MKLKLFSYLKEQAKQSYIKIPMDTCTVEELKTYLLNNHPELNLSGVLFSVNLEYSVDSDVLTLEDEIALIPPVSGG